MGLLGCGRFVFSLHVHSLCFPGITNYNWWHAVTVPVAGGACSWTTCASSLSWPASGM